MNASIELQEEFRFKAIKKKKIRDVHDRTEDFKPKTALLTGVRSVVINVKPSNGDRIS